MPTYKVNWRLRGLKRIKVLLPGQTIKLTVAEAARFVARGVLSPCAGGEGDIATPIAVEHVQFLQARGYAVNTVEEALTAFVANLHGTDRVGFMADAAAWIIAQKNAGQPVDLSAMTKAQLVDYGRTRLALSLDITKTKSDLLTAIAEAASK